MEEQVRCCSSLHVDVFVPLLNELKRLRIVFHSLPLQQLLPLCLAAYSVKYGTQNKHQSEEARR